MNKFTLQIFIFILLGTGAIAVTSQTPTNSLSKNSIIEANQPKRLKITLTINDPADLKIREGDRVSKGQILSDRDLERKRLTRERMATLMTINKIERSPLPILKIAPELRELPPISFATVLKGCLLKCWNTKPRNYGRNRANKKPPKLSLIFTMQNIDRLKHSDRNPSGTYRIRCNCHGQI